MMSAVRYPFTARFGSLFSALFAIAIAATLALGQAQVTTADLTGTVTDPNDAVVAGATVTARNTGTGVTRNVTTGTDGTYSFIGLPPGDYEITAEAPTFKKVVISPVRLTVGQSAELRVRMEVGAPDVVVNVSGDQVALIETTRTSVANTIETERIENLPINERSATG